MGVSEILFWVVFVLGSAVMITGAAMMFFAKTERRESRGQMYLLIGFAIAGVGMVFRNGVLSFFGF